MQKEGDGGGGGRGDIDVCSNQLIFPHFPENQNQLRWKRCYLLIDMNLRNKIINMVEVVSAAAGSALEKSGKSGLIKPEKELMALTRNGCR
ncbi:MAG: hypothetical protein IPN76_32110 [Saprospiraceae bacterium]|nr:hypothetical protein [Saprospiraceae bacterium]